MEGVEKIKNFKTVKFQRDDDDDDDEEEEEEEEDDEEEELVYIFLSLVVRNSRCVIRRGF